MLTLGQRRKILGARFFGEADGGFRDAISHEYA